MKALILYVGLVVIGAAVSALLGIYLERTISSTVSLIVFLTCFFANFAVSWLVVIYIMDGTLKKAGV
jgi:tellurite resistance protein TehA-like permease